MPLLIQPNQKIVFIGDSITDCGRRDAHKPLGVGFVRFFADYALIREPQKQFFIENKGIGGNKVTQLRDRWSDDVTRENPDFLVVKIGVNDCVSHLLGASDGVSPSLFEETYAAILTRTKEALPNCQILLLDPFYLSVDPPSETFWRGRMKKNLPLYIEIVGKMAAKFGVKHIETQRLFDAILAHHSNEVLAPEPVHPHQTGHLLIADAVYAALSE